MEFTILHILGGTHDGNVQLTVPGADMIPVDEVDMEDRKFHGGETINTLRKFTEQEKAYMEEFDLQLKNR